MNSHSPHSLSEIESLWRTYLRIYGEPQVRVALRDRWQNDPNVAQERIQLDFPPTFQPGYVGASFFDSEARLVFLGYNPGEGRQATSQSEDQVLGRWLQRFTEGHENLLSLSHFQAAHVVKWPIYSGKGIFRETDDLTIELLHSTVRPSIHSVALLNLFPFKTVANKKPLSGWGGPDTSLKTHMWDRLVKPTLELLTPQVIVHYPDADSYTSRLSLLPTKPRLIRVWHPSDYNLNAQRQGLKQAWQHLEAALRGITT